MPAIPDMPESILCAVCATQVRRGFCDRIPKFRFAVLLVKRSEKLFVGHDSATVAVRDVLFQTQWLNRMSDNVSLQPLLWCRGCVQIFAKVI